jgi:hypothetical protein
MSACGNKKPRVLFGVPEGDYYAQQFVAVASAMPDAECRFIGFSWSTGLEIRKAGLHYSHVAWWSRASVPPQLVPHVADFTVRGYTQGTVPKSTKRAFAALDDFIESEVEKFTPDVVVYGPIDHSICYLIDKCASRRGIPRLGIQPSFISNHFIIHSQGEHWVEHLRTAELPDYSDFEVLKGSPPKVNGLLRRVTNSKPVWDLHLWIRGAECAARVLSGGTSFDTLQSLTSLFISRIIPPKWFPLVETLKSLEDVKKDFVLVALNQPALGSWDSPNWVDLVTFAVKATPEDTLIILRPHPSEVTRVVPTELKDLLHSRNVRVSRAGCGPELEEIIQHCKAVVTLSSSIGMEALYAGALVFTIGSAFYARPGMAKAVTLSDTGLAREMVTREEEFRPVASEVDRFTTWLINDCMVPSPLLSSDAGTRLEDCIRALVNHSRGIDESDQ